ncbi:MAG: Gfo/Idh/MocA family oxidoreductase [Acidobacteria bacterium]|nr:Gfo/Idh/MocA family oxidoreductase [Acidobacteriota bacterium]
MVCCYAPTQDRREIFARRHMCHAASSYEKVLVDPGLEAVVLATPNSLNRSQIKAAVERSKHVFV